MVNPFTTLQFQYPFRKYQQMILEVVGHAEDQKHHIVAPPGAGKTIVGLEMIRRSGRPAVVFAPTTTIQRQWQEKVGLFTTDNAWLATHTSLDASHLADITVLTYQGLSTPGENLDFVERVAIDRWVDDLLTSGQAVDEAEARQRIATIQQQNPKAAKREISKRYRRVKRDFLNQPDFDGRQFLHRNARDLIDRIIKLNVGMIVLDECHHLLDYWAFILRELIRELPDAQVVGLTATLPDPANKREFENYQTLLGEVDFEVPTPAVVKEGNLAPYRDLVYFCEPSKREMAYLQQIQTHLETAVATITATPAFRIWIDKLLHPAEPFAELFNQEPLLYIAAVKWWLNAERPLPEAVPFVAEMTEPVQVDDWLTLLEQFGLRVLKVSADPAYQALYRQLRDALLNFGITISERGIRHQRSLGDLVLALSEAKDAAVVKILQAEAAQMGEKLRAVVITDFERMSARARRLKDVLDPNAGSAVRLFQQLIADATTNALDPVLVTGKVVLVSGNNRDRLEQGIVNWQKANQSRFAWEWQATDNAQIWELTGSGRDWGSRTYVALLTYLFEQGITQCLVGTRGIFGEGWDALTLNTLIDLTAVTTSTGVRQIRGRTIRLDPGWTRKVAHNWDVVCVSKKFDKGNNDLRRFEAKHAHTWGIIMRHKGADLIEAAATAVAGQVPGMSQQGQIARGVAHVDMDLASALYAKPFQKIKFTQYNRRMLAAVKRRDTVYDAWAIGAPYSNFAYRVTQIQPRDLTFQTVYRVKESLRAMLWRLLASGLGVAILVWLYGGQAFLSLGELPGSWIAPLVLGIFTLGIVVSLIANGRAIWKLFQRAFLELPADDILLDVGQALLAALADAGAISRNLNENYVRVVATPEGGYQVFLDYASPEDASAFALAYEQLLGPIHDARYLIERDTSSLRNPLYRALWLGIRPLLVGLDTRAYHRVPDLLASRKERAEALARHWQRTVGGGRLVYTRHAEGRAILLQARSQQHKQIRQMAFELWR